MTEGVRAVAWCLPPEKYLLAWSTRLVTILKNSFH